MSSGVEDHFRIRGQLWLADLRFRGGRPLFIARPLHSWIFR